MRNITGRDLLAILFLGKLDAMREFSSQNDFTKPIDPKWSMAVVRKKQ